MREKEQKRVGLYVLLVNILMILFITTSQEFDKPSMVIAFVSSIIALLFSFNFMRMYKNKHNVITFIINFLIANSLLFVLIYII